MNVVERLPWLLILRHELNALNWSNGTSKCMFVLSGFEITDEDASGLPTLRLLVHTLYVFGIDNRLHS
jgi:hypothetical protein